MEPLQPGPTWIRNARMNLSTRYADRPSAFVRDVLKKADLHDKRIEALGEATASAISAARLGVKVIGAALAKNHGIAVKHGIKQVDRLLSNDGVDVWALFAQWVPYVVGARTEIKAALDWTDFDKDGQSTICLYLLTRHGRATPLIWKTVYKSDLAKRRNEFEDEVLMRLRELVPKSVAVTILADRGFGDQKLYAFMKELNFGYVIRFRDAILVEDAVGVQRPAAEWLAANGRARKIAPARVTKDAYEIPAVVCVHARGMKEPWCLATSIKDTPAAQIIALYGKRFTIEETFRDTKNLRFGMGLTDAGIKQPARRDRLLLIGALATALLTLLGAACEEAGLDRLFKANTVKTRTHSLFNQGSMCYEFLPGMRDEWLTPLLIAFEKQIRGHRVFSGALGVI